jgi:hypothetical protein
MTDILKKYENESKNNERGENDDELLKELGKTEGKQSEVITEDLTTKKNPKKKERIEKDEQERINREKEQERLRKEKLRIARDVEKKRIEQLKDDEKKRIEQLKKSEEEEKKRKELEKKTKELEKKTKELEKKTKMKLKMEIDEKIRDECLHEINKYEIKLACLDKIEIIDDYKRATYVIFGELFYEYIAFLTDLLQTKKLFYIIVMGGSSIEKQCSEYKTNDVDVKFIPYDIDTIIKYNDENYKFIIDIIWNSFFRP